MIRRDLPEEKALLGFAGAPFTVASYMVEGQSTRDFQRTKAMLLSEPEIFHALLEKIAASTIVCLKAQVEAGVDAIQLFDSWAGYLSPMDYEEFALRHTRTVLEVVSDMGVPTILYANGSGGFLELMATSGADCISVDWRVGLGDAWKRIGHDLAIQGNLDPTILFGPEEVVVQRAHAILDEAQGRPGHVFNLGHGIQKTTPVPQVLALVQAVRDYSP